MVTYELNSKARTCDIFKGGVLVEQCSLAEMHERLAAHGFTARRQTARQIDRAERQQRGNVNGYGHSRSTRSVRGW